jgi:hypothetical protein
VIVVAIVNSIENLLSKLLDTCFRFLRYHTALIRGERCLVGEFICDSLRCSLCFRTLRVFLSATCWRLMNILIL